MQAFWWWWGVAVLLGMFEMLTATFFLLVLGLGCAAAGFVAWAGGGMTSQLLVAAVVSFVGWLLLRRLAPRLRRRDAPPGRDVLLDIGERVHVDRWESDCKTRVIYRGTEWRAELDDGEPGSPAPGDYLIRRIDGNRLIIAARKPAANAAQTPAAH